MQVLLLKKWPGLGKVGEIKEVSVGHANHFLIPKGIAVSATAEVKRQSAESQAASQAKQEKQLAKLQALKKDLEKRTFTVQVKVGESGQIFGGIREKEILQNINADLNLSLDKNQLRLESSLKQLGEHQVSIDLGRKIYATLKIKLEAETPPNL